MAAAHCRVEFEFWAHQRFALEAGVSPELVASLAEGGELRDATDDDRMIVECSVELLRSGRLSEAQYTMLIAVLGPAGVVDFVETLGFHCLVSFNLNVFEVPAPERFVPPWGEVETSRRPAAVSSETPLRSDRPRREGE